MKLNKHHLIDIPVNEKLVKPKAETFSLPEKVLQFGTGILLRALPDFMINQANNNGFFNGRIVVVKSTTTGATDAFDAQNGLYTVCIRGFDNGEIKNENHIVSSISRVLSANNDWDEILECAANPEMQVIISNTTEVGITLTTDNIHHAPPVSFPGKMVAFLYQRFKHFKGDISKGMVIVPAELIPNNGDVLLSIVLELAHQNNLEISFIDWIENANFFCNSLVDRIVPGRLKAEEQKELENELGFEDELMIVSEAYSLWAIESAEQKVKDILSFATGNDAVIIAPDINKFRELKLRLLNGSHTFSCGLAHLAGFETVNEAMAYPVFYNYINALMTEEISSVIAKGNISEAEARSFAAKVLDRYRNDFIEHKWLSIATQYSSKMLMRNLDLIKGFVETDGYLPPHMALGMAAHILFMKGHVAADKRYVGTVGNTEYVINDTNAAIYSKAWAMSDARKTVLSVLSDESLWQCDLSLIPNVSETVYLWLNILINDGAIAAMEMANKQKKQLAK